MPPRPRPPPGPPRPPWPTPPPSPANADTIADLPHASKLRYPLHTSAKSLIDLVLDQSSDLTTLLQIRERRMVILVTSNIFDASVIDHALLSLKWEGVVEGAEEI
ncbi:hypothetical protein HO173_007637 [Letharia columbiana]|uniref:Uncharacterized protein n=1 Tax=Letharia columbiana TaxID=112416 RepID=A0A8H6FT28_9LECA|nr:uncharacterized protein HO173_007637 [Letharia columbiana]KAF6234217.1 hypothetical protein HO173_007637 [Letharia columbiana]